MLYLSFLPLMLSNRKVFLKKAACIAFICLTVSAVSSCGTIPDNNSDSSAQTAINTYTTAAEWALSSADTSADVMEGDIGTPSPSPFASAEGDAYSARRIRVRFGGNTVVYELNDSPAAASLYEQLPLTIEVKNFGSNEKIFYPPSELDISQTPLADGGAGTLAYYAPWGDVVMFYGDYSKNSSLYELGRIVSGEERLREMTGVITVEAWQ